MPKLVTEKRLEGVVEQARNYVKVHILFPSGLLGLILIVSSLGALGYQLLGTDSYTWGTFWESIGLLIAGGVLGWAQTRYHQYVLHHYPEVFASRMRRPGEGKKGRHRRDTSVPASVPPGRRWIPLYYCLGILALVGLSLLATVYGHVSGVAAALLPWGGFFWAKLFFWRGMIK
jgi:hypothetical protein